MLENKKTSNGIHYSRYIMSWNDAGGEYYGNMFLDWLKSEGCSDNEISDIKEMAMMGKFELEVSAEKFIKNYKDKD